MDRIKKPLFILGACLIIMGCQKKDINAPQGIFNRYFPLAIGNYWIFDYQNVMPDGTPAGNVQEDTLKIIGDTLIGNSTFYTFLTNKPAANTKWYLRDSVGYIINLQGYIMLSPEPNTDKYNEHYQISNSQDTLYFYFDEFPSKRMIESFEGDMICLERLTTHELHENLGGQTTVDSSYYSIIGPVRLSYAYASGVKIKGTLTEYHLE